MVNHCHLEALILGAESPGGQCLGIGVSVSRKEAKNKVTGVAKYNADFTAPGCLHARMVTSPHAHARIRYIDTSMVSRAPGVRAVITGEYAPVLCGPLIEDRPPIAVNKVRYFGEPVALVVADSEHQAKSAARLVKVEYEPLPVVASPGEALKNETLVHENLALYQCLSAEVYPEGGTNIADRKQIRKGDMAKGWGESEVVVEAVYTFPQSDHAAMETRNARAEIQTNGQVIIHTSSQAPFSVREWISRYFNVDMGRVVVKVPLVGGAFGGKAAVTIEVLAYLASRAVGGRPVRIACTREEDMVSFPCRLGLEATVKLGADRQGTLKAADFKYLVDCGAYSDITPQMTRAMVVCCTGPYNIPNVRCDAWCLYTNHPFVTSFRGFCHASFTFAVERAMDKLAFALGMDPLELRLKNAVTAGNTSPTQVGITLSNTGNLGSCLEELKKLVNWDEGIRLEMGGNRVRAKGVTCFWKTSDSPADAHSGAVLSFNEDGSININCGVVECGPGMKTAACQILAEKMKMDVNRIHIAMEVDTSINPKHWKTVASMTTYMLGRAILKAAEDLIGQLRSVAAVVLRCPPEDLEVAGEKVFMRDDPGVYIDFPAIVHGYKYPNGNSIRGQIIGRGSFIMKHLTTLDRYTGQGKAGPYWTVGAQAIEVEYDTRNLTYDIKKAATVLDAGKVINPMTARGVVTGGMCMGLGLGSRESFEYGASGVVENTSLRTYRLLHFGQNPEYLVEFVENPQLEAPYGARGLGEHGLLGIPAALANALSCAAQVELNRLPITPELIWRTQTENIN